MRTNTASSMQKTYDECYLKCSTAVYFEDKNNEAEALRSWRSALDQIYYHNAYRVPAHYRPRTETERALQESLRDMEMQCKERVDLLDALKESRAVAEAGGDSPPGPASVARSGVLRSPRSSVGQERGYVGQGTVPAVTYPDLSRPGQAPALPRRPAVLAKKSSDTDTPRASTRSPSTFTQPLPPPVKKSSRSPSPEKKGLRMTLRTGKDAKKRSRSPRPSGQRKASGAAASKAATQAWGVLPRPAKDSVGRSHGEMASTTTLNSVHRDGRAESDSRKPSTENNPFVNPPSPTNYLPGVRGPSTSSTTRPNSQQVVANSGPTLQAPALDDSLPSDQLEHRKSAEAQAQRTRRASPQRPRTASYEWPVYQSRESSTSEKVLRPNQPQRHTGLPSRPRSPQRKAQVPEKAATPVSRKPVSGNASALRTQRRLRPSASDDDTTGSSRDAEPAARRTAEGRPRRKAGQREEPTPTESPSPSSSDCFDRPSSSAAKSWKTRVDRLMDNLPKGVNETAARQIFNEIVVQGDEVHWDDVAGLDVAKNALKEAVVYPFLRPDLFMGLREPARGMLLFGPPGTGKTMLARAVATESRSTFFSISASSLTSKYLGESEKLVRALFALAKVLAPSIIFVDEIDSLLSSRSGTEHEATRRIKTEFLIQWSDLARAAAGREQSDKEKERGDASRVLVLAATNMPWAIDEAARRRFVRRQYIPLPEGKVRATQLRTLLGHQKHSLSEDDIEELISLTDGFSGSDITALAKDAAMGPLRSLGEALLHMSMDEIRPIRMGDFKASLVNIRPSVSRQGLQEFEEWAKEFGERGG
ncbi:MAG: hypothetical protein M1832_003501 [Thelocarpon impressellum]|nr:MAG: hypothetical protein M1832_003501 [Thelocarpon impressellum]